MRTITRTANLPIWITVSLLSVLLMVSLIVQLIMAWQAHQRIAPVSAHVTLLEGLQGALFDTEESLARLPPESNLLASGTRQHLQGLLQALLDKDNHLATDTPGRLRAARQALNDQSANPKILLLNVLKTLRTAFRNEATAHKVLTDSIATAATFEFEFGIAIMLALPLSAAILIYLMRRRIFEPLQQMSYLMELLGNRHYQQIPVERIDPTFQPILANYNGMVVRLSELEAEHLQYQQNLEQQVEQAAGALIAQQRSMAQSDRLAALGEVTARLVHELRNPLAGIKMACINLKNQLKTAAVADDALDRIDLVINEIERIIDTMNHFLQGARHEPEPLKDIVIDQAVGELLMLARYQLPKNISLDYRGCPNLVCRLPDSEFRQALLNLILNAQQALSGNTGGIQVQAECRDRHLLIRVCDDGPGFSEAFLQDGIRAFVSQRKDGTGLGLAMVKRFVRNHEGSLKIYNCQPQGACVEITLNCIRPGHD
ncbi:MAG: ATP-binding protein [Methylomonas sp.]|jgi:signal transduction histidine kinase|uniref:sensor histidine kinase n=1 Tax=Methylomonas sp. TaxID=418 RepID=UPI0025CCC629|nr:ATP-binding protein [Methylomonas sp.]MCK9609037.1 ATP-binding protein [Methylomonas sp.]